MESPLAGDELDATVAVVSDEDVADVVDAQSLGFPQHVRPAGVVGEEELSLRGDALHRVRRHVRHHVVALLGKGHVARLHEDGAAGVVNVEGVGDVTLAVDDVEAGFGQTGHEEAVGRRGEGDGVVLFEGLNTTFQRHAA